MCDVCVYDDSVPPPPQLKTLEAGREFRSDIEEALRVVAEDQAEAAAESAAVDERIAALSVAAGDGGDFTDGDWQQLTLMSREHAKVGARAAALGRQREQLER